MVINIWRQSEDLNICLGGDDNIQREKDGIIVVLQYAKQDGRKYIRDTFGGRKGITMTI